MVNVNSLSKPSKYMSSTSPFIVAVYTDEFLDNLQGKLDK